MALKRLCIPSLLVALAFAAAPADAQDGEKVEPRVVGGTPAEPGEYPFAAYVENSFASCGGTLMATDKVLTAAHCVSTLGGAEVPAADFLLCIGEIDLADGCETQNTYTVLDVDRHEGYDDDTLQNDVAMLTLARGAPQQPLRLVMLSEGELWDDNSPATIVGWGSTDDGEPPSDDLLEAPVPMVSDAECDTAYDDDGLSFTNFDPVTMVCAGDAEHDTCEGDSGGPLMVTDSAGGLALVGVTSWGNECAGSEPGVYARVASDPLNAWVRARLPGAGGTGGTGDTASAGPAPDLTPPVLSSVAASRRTFAVRRRGRSERPVASARRGTTFRYRLSENARVLFTIERARPGRRSGRRCVRPTPSNRRARRCTRYRRFGRFAQFGRAGANSKRFSGKIGRRSMPPGRYRATMWATDPAGNRSSRRRLMLRVVRR